MQVQGHLQYLHLQYVVDNKGSHRECRSFSSVVFLIGPRSQYAAWKRFCSVIECWVFTICKVSSKVGQCRKSFSPGFKNNFLSKFASRQLCLTIVSEVSTVTVCCSKELALVSYLMEYSRNSQQFIFTNKTCALSNDNSAEAQIFLSVLWRITHKIFLVHKLQLNKFFFQFPTIVQQYSSKQTTFCNFIWPCHNFWSVFLPAFQSAVDPRSSWGQLTELLDTCYCFAHATCHVDMLTDTRQTELLGCFASLCSLCLRSCAQICSNRKPLSNIELNLSFLFLLCTAIIAIAPNFSH